MSIAIPDRFFDYVIYYECGHNERLNPSAFQNIGSLPAGSLLKAVNWNASGNDIHDGQGVTKVGVTPVAISAYKKWSHNNGFVLNSAYSWMQIVNYFWKEAYADQAANVACAVILCQGRWGGWGSTSLKNTCEQLKQKCDNKTKAASIKGTGFQALSQLTHCFSNPMDAFIILRSCRIAYLRSCSNASKFMGGWSRREFWAMQKNGLYCDPGTKEFTKYGFAPISEMEKVAEQLKKNPQSGYVKLMSWDETPSENLSLEGLDDGSNPNYNPVGDISQNLGGFTASHGSNIDGGVIDMSQLGVDNSQKDGLVLGMTILQKRERKL